MLHTFIADDKYCLYLLKIDQEIAQKAQAERCPYCGGRLDRADYRRKAKGGLIAAAGEAPAYEIRFSLCCSQEGCRKRVTPVSLRFWGRRVYLGVAILIGSLFHAVEKSAAVIQDQTQIIPRTIRRWSTWWQNAFCHSPFFVEASARCDPPLEKTNLPASIMERISQNGYTTDEEKVTSLLFWISPITTSNPRTNHAIYWTIKDTQKMTLGLCGSMGVGMDY